MPGEKCAADHKPGGLSQMKEKLLETLTGLDLLKNFTPGQINDLFFKKRLARIVEYEAGERILCEGHYDNWVYWIIEGRVAVVKDEIVVASLQRMGDMFGEMAVLDGDARTADVEALSHTICLELDMSVLDHPLLKERMSREAFCRNIAQLVKERLASTTRRLSGVERELYETRKALAQREDALKRTSADLQRLMQVNADQDKVIKELMAKLEDFRAR